MFVRKIFVTTAALALPFTLQAQGLIVPKLLAQNTARTFTQEVLANNIRRAITLNSASVPAHFVLPVQQQAYAPLSLDELHFQLANSRYTPLFLSSFLQ